MIEARTDTRFPCAQDVLVVGVKGARRLNVQKATITDISSNGLLLKFEKAPADCDRVQVRTPVGDVLTYEVRHRRERNGFHFLGVQVVKC